MERLSPMVSNASEVMVEYVGNAIPTRLPQNTTANDGKEKHIGLKRRRDEETFATEYGREIMKKAGISEDKIALVHLCLGYPTTTANVVKKRKEGRIKFL